VVEEAIDHKAGTHIDLQLRGAALEKHIVRGDAGADRHVDDVAEEPEQPLTDFECSEDGNPVEVAQQLKGSNERVDLGLLRNWRLDRRADAREPEIVGCDGELHSVRPGLLRTGGG
jgi:hypothetical protein